MNKNNSKKITTLGVVIFSFLGLVLYVLIVCLLGCLASLVVLKTNLSDGFLRVFSLVGSGLGLLVSTATLTVMGKMRGILASVIMGVLVLLLKLIGNASVGMGGYWSFSGLIGIFFIAVFSLAGGLVGTAIKRR